MARHISLALLLCLAVFVSYGRGLPVVPEAKKLALFPGRLGGWVMKGEVIFDAPVLRVLRPSDYLMRVYADGRGESIELYVGFHDGGPGSGPIHSPRNCLPGAGWELMNSRDMDLPTPAGSVRMVRAVYAKGAERSLFYYWYQVRGDSLTSDFALKLAELKGMLLERRRDAAFIRLHLRENAGADAAVSDFLKAAYPELRRFLPGAE